MKRTFITSIILFFTCYSVLAAGLERHNKQDDFYDVADIQVTKVDADDAEMLLMQRDGMGLGDIIDAAEKLIAFGTKVWEIIKAGEPNAELSLAKPISVLPYKKDDLSAYTEMYSWTAPAVSSYLVEFKNVYGNVLVSFRYNVAFQYNGTMEGKGRYITGLKVNASSVYVMWGVSFDATSELQSISNRGTMENPVAGATMVLSYKVGTAFSKVSETQSFHMTGLGEFITY